ncbi:hypothetical protein Dimus_031378 [Dionaea muscipula]
MGACLSSPSGCLREPSSQGNIPCSSNKSSRKKKKRLMRRGINGRRVPSHHLPSTSDLDNSIFEPQDRSFTIQGSAEEAWFDSISTIFESDCEDDFHSVQDHELVLTANYALEHASMISNYYSSMRDDHYIHFNSAAISSTTDRGRNSSSFSEVIGRSSSSDQAKQQLVFIDDISSSVDHENAAARDQEGVLLDHCGIIHINNCLPCLANSTVHSVEKRPRSLSSSPPPSARTKKPPIKLPFKWKDAHSNSSLLSSMMLLRRPIAGSQVPFCPVEKDIFDSWSQIEPSGFKVRGQNFFKDKKKNLAPSCAAYYPFGVDVFLSPRKVDHIARFVELPSVNSSGNNFPPLLIVNVQIPLYPATIFQGEADGEGMSIVLYFKLNDTLCKELPSHFLESMRRLMDDEVEKVKAFPVDTNLPFRERLKILGYVVNVEDIPLSAAERKLMNAYNEKPVLSRPQHEFYSGNKAEELPEHILCCIRLNRIDYMNYQQLGLNHEP